VAAAAIPPIAAGVRSDRGVSSIEETFIGYVECGVWGVKSASDEVPDVAGDDKLDAADESVLVVIDSGVDAVVAFNTKFVVTTTVVNVIQKIVGLDAVGSQITRDGLSPPV